MTEAKYQHIGSPVGERTIHLPYSGSYRNLGFDTSKITREAIHAYDIGGTLANAQKRDQVIRETLRLEGEVKELLFKDTELTQRISEAQALGIASGKITVRPWDGVVEQLVKEREEGYGTLAITVGTYQMARSFLGGARLTQYMDGLITTEEASLYGVDVSKKTEELFILTYTKLVDKFGMPIVSYTDNNVAEVHAAIAARKELVKRYGEIAKFPVYHLKTNATEEELGQTSTGHIVIRTIKEKRE